MQQNATRDLVALCGRVVCNTRRLNKGSCSDKCNNIYIKCRGNLANNVWDHELCQMQQS